MHFLSTYKRSITTAITAPLARRLLLYTAAWAAVCLGAQLLYGVRPSAWHSALSLLLGGDNDGAGECASVRVLLAQLGFLLTTRATAAAPRLSHSPAAATTNGTTGVTTNGTEASSEGNALDGSSTSLMRWWWALLADVMVLVVCGVLYSRYLLRRITSMSITLNKANHWQRLFKGSGSISK